MSSKEEEKVYCKRQARHQHQHQQQQQQQTELFCVQGCGLPGKEPSWKHANSRDVQVIAAWERKGSKNKLLFFCQFLAVFKTPLADRRRMRPVL